MTTQIAPKRVDLFHGFSGRALFTVGRLTINSGPPHKIYISNIFRIYFEHISNVFDHRFKRSTHFSAICV